MNVQPPLTWMVVVGVGVVALLIVFAVISVAIAWWVFRPRPEPIRVKPVVPSFDLTSLDVAAVPASAPRLEYYGCPVRLVMLVLAPVGRDGEIPDKDQLPELLEHIVPLFVQVVGTHEPEVQFWPAQVSTAGFSNAFFGSVAMPGDRGKGTPWCGLAGRFDAFGKHYLAGLVCYGDDARGLGQLVIEQEGLWRDVLRVKA